MPLQIIGNEFNEKMGYIKIQLSNRERLLLTRGEYNNLKIKENHNHLMFESTSGNFYNPFDVNGTVHFKMI